MEVFFEPMMLKQVQKEIAVLHKSTKKELSVISVDDQLRELIESLVGLEESALAIRTEALDYLDICRIAGYLPFNYFNVNMRNLFRIFVTRSNIGACRILYKYWQNSYENEDCNEFIQLLLRNDTEFQRCIKENHLDLEWMEDIIQHQNIVGGFGAKIRYYPFDERKNLEEKFEYFGIKDDSKLYRDCIDAFYVYCEKNDYMEADREILLETVKKYQKRNLPLLKSFLSNFLNKLELEELADFQDVSRYLNTIFGDDPWKKGSYKSFFKDISGSLIEKYMDWINICRIEQYFGNDDRSEFWKQYRFLKVQRFDKSNAVVMIFKEYVAVEFLGKAAGPIYFYPKDYYETTLKFVFPVFENSQMPRYLYNQTKYDPKKDRFEHMGENWKNKVANYIITHHITRKVFA